MTEAGWYSDPLGEGSLRWFDGESWTDHLADADPSTIDVPEQAAHAPMVGPLPEADVTASRPALRREAEAAEPEVAEVAPPVMPLSFPPPSGPPVEVSPLQRPSLQAEVPTERSDRLTPASWLLALAFVVALLAGERRGSISDALLIVGFGTALASALAPRRRAELRRSVLLVGSAYLAVRLVLSMADLVLPVPGFVSSIAGVPDRGPATLAKVLPSVGIAVAAAAIGLGSPASRPARSTSQDPADPVATEGLATPGQRFGAFVLESVLLIATLFVGYFVWALVVYGKGQSPGKQVLGLRVVDNTTQVAATWGKMFFREVAVKGLIGSVTFGLFSVIGGLIMAGRPDRSAPWDRMADTRVVMDRSGSLVR